MKPELHDIDAFYRRQRRDILARIEERRGAGKRWLMLAAAAVLALAALGVALQSFRTPAPQGIDLQAVLGEATLPLPAFGAWNEVELQEDDDEGAELGSVDWLLGDGSSALTGTDAYPEFLKPFGSSEKETFEAKPSSAFQVHHDEGDCSTRVRCT